MEFNRGGKTVSGSWDMPIPITPTNRDILNSINCSYTEKHNKFRVKLNNLWGSICDKNAIDAAEYFAQYFQSKNWGLIKSYIIKEYLIDAGPVLYTIKPDKLHYLNRTKKIEKFIA
jgi:hypothetical protein